jgi:hypothetical protein
MLRGKEKLNSPTAINVISYQISQNYVKYIDSVKNDVVRCTNWPHNMLSFYKLCAEFSDYLVAKCIR